MTRLVLHAGTPGTGATLVRAQLLALRGQLERSGVSLVADDDVETWDRAALRVVSGDNARAVTKLVRDDDLRPQMILVSAGSIAHPLAQPINVENVRQFGRAYGLTCRVVVVVREQLDLLNAMYRDQVLDMETFDDFDAFLAGLGDLSQFRYDVELRALLDAPNVEVVVLPHSRLTPGAEAAEILLAAGLDEETVSGLAVSAGDEQAVRSSSGLPGPVLVAATRLLHKRLAHADVQRKGRLVKAARRLRQRADQQSWDDTEFWGWSTELAASTAAGYEAGNQLLAERAWGADWPDPPQLRPTQSFDLATQPPALVGDVLTTIQAVVEEITT